MSTTKIPGDESGRAKFLYHPTHEGARRVDLKDKDIAETELRRLRAEGWQERRVAMTLYHAKLGAKVFRSDAEVGTALQTGWQDVPFSGDAHADAIHPHENDTHRQLQKSLESADDSGENGDEDAEAKAVAKAARAEAKAAKLAAKNKGE